MSKSINLSSDLLLGSSFGTKLNLYLKLRRSYGELHKPEIYDLCPTLCFLAPKLACVIDQPVKDP